MTGTKANKAAAKQPRPTTKVKGTMTATFPQASEPEKAAALARMVLRPSVNAAAVMETYAKPLGEQNLAALVDALSAGMDDVWAGDLKRAEAMLYGQAHALQAIFMNLARRAASQEYLKQWEAYLRMALKAQNQCRMTLETLATIKNPPVVFARQVNINNGGQQQVNNGAAPPAAQDLARATIPPAAPSELLEGEHGEWMGPGTTGAAGGADPHLEAVGAIHRPANR